VRVDVPLSDGKTLAWIYARGEVLGRRDDGEAAHLSVRLSDADLGRLRHRQRLHSYLRPSARMACAASIHLCTRPIRGNASKD
jgi:hypothetical protein